MLLVESKSLDVYRNLAIEEYLMDQVMENGPILFLWQSEQAVVMGKNQNPWRECRLDRMREAGVPLARRISGGGTVYHDAGNLNYCVIVDRTAYREEQAYEMVLQALRTLGIDATKTGKSNLSVSGRKFSGNAFCFRRNRALHHGTLLLNTDLEKLKRYLGAMFDRITTRAIASVPAAVMNLGLDVDTLSLALAERFRSGYGGTDPLRWTDSDLDEGMLEPQMIRQRSDDWKYGACPRFVVDLPESTLEIEHGIVVQVKGQNSGWKGKPFAEVAYSIACEVD